MGGRRPALALLEECGGVDWMPWGDAGVDRFEFGLCWSNEIDRDVSLNVVRGFLRGEPIRSGQSN